MRRAFSDPSARRGGLQRRRVHASWRRRRVCASSGAPDRLRTVDLPHARHGPALGLGLGLWRGLQGGCLAGALIVGIAHDDVAPLA
eukprot:5781629-Alexandrium_andersonii.AAC.1